MWFPVSDQHDVNFGCETAFDVSNFKPNFGCETAFDVSKIGKVDNSLFKNKVNFYTNRKYVVSSNHKS